MNRSAESAPVGHCPDCGSSYQKRPLRAREELRCRVCGHRLERAFHPHQLQVLWALATTGLLLVALANIGIILTFDVAGNTQSNRILTGVAGLVAQNFAPVAALVFFAAVAAPAAHLAALWYVAGACCHGRRWPGVGLAARLATRLEPWNLVPVYSVAILVAVVKLDLLGQVEWHLGAGWILLLSLCSLFATQIHDRQAIAERLARLP